MDKVTFKSGTWGKGDAFSHEILYINNRKVRFCPFLGVKRTIDKPSSKQFPYCILSRAPRKHFLPMQCLLSLFFFFFFWLLTI